MSIWRRRFLCAIGLHKWRGPVGWGAAGWRIDRCDERGHEDLIA